MKLIILGAGGYGRTIADVAEQSGKYEKVLFLDDNAKGDDILGKISEFKTYIDGDTEFYPAIGNNQKRIEWIHSLEAEDVLVATIIHPSAYISPKAIIGKGVGILPGAIINTDVVVGCGCIINIGTIVDHGTVLEEGVHLAPGAIVKGENKIEAFSKVESGEVIEARSRG